MLRSMTGFGSGDYEDDDYKLHIEVKSVNQRYLEINMHMPHGLAALEADAVKLIRTYASRGKLDVNVNFLDKREKEQCIRVDKSLAIAYHKALNEMSDLLHLARPDDVSTVANYPEVLTLSEGMLDIARARTALLTALRTALDGFLVMREAEGRNLQQDFVGRLDTLQELVGKIAAFAPEIVVAYRERLQKTICELLAKDAIDETRIIQETAIYADKINYTEEVVRLQSHFQQFRSMIEDPAEPMGRKLDFLVQEMNREVNTIASKANCAEAAQLVVDCKSEIEKIREQIQNVE